MIHNDIGELKPALQNRVRAALEEMRSDQKLKNLGVTSIAVSEAMREMAVQMAYRSRLLWTELRATIPAEQHEATKRAVVAYVQEMYKAAGLYQISATDALVPVTWTLYSKHIRGEAIDLVPNRNGSYWWAAPPEVWKRMGEIGEANGLSWGGRWKNADCPHFEVA